MSTAHYTSQQQTPPKAHKASAHAAKRLPRDPNRAMQQMMETIDELRNVYIRETDALERMDTRGFMAVQDDKINSAILYEAGITEMMARKAEMKNVDPKLKAQLTKMQAEFSDLTQKNMQALERMKRTMDRLSGKIRHEAKEEAKKQRVFSYGYNGAVEDDDKKLISTGVIEDA